MVVIPQLIDFSAPIVQRPLTRNRLIILGPAAANKRRLTKLLGQSVLNITQRVASRVGRVYARVAEPPERGEPLLPGDDCLEEVEQVVMLGGLGALR